MSKINDKVTINIDYQVLKVVRGSTILEAAQKNGIYIPTLCSYKELTPFGGCRMCIVEVEGARGFPTACATPVEQGMVIRTQTAQVQSVRKEILQLILSEHTSSCLICEEKDECKNYTGTIRKAGVTTGCRYCPNDAQCELQEVVEKLGMKEINYPIYYRHLQVEKEDPFYDRDYNLCILCGRCIRMCQEIRTANVLAFKQRGRFTVIGPAYDRTHLEAGCEFCGACVSVCPTGALSEKVRKWEGKAEREEITTCPLCGIGCQMRLLIKKGEIIGTLPAEDPLGNNGQLCVKGRFCVTELVNGHRRLRKPYKTQNGTKVEISWNETLELAAEKLSACPPQEFSLLISANCCNEDLYIAQKFARVVMGSNNIDTPARVFYGAGFNSYLNLMKRAVPLSCLQKASVILCIGLDTRFGRSVAGVGLRQAINRGAKIITIHPRYHNLALIAEKWLQPVPGTEIEHLSLLVSLTEKKTGSLPFRAKGKKKDLDELSRISKLLKEALAPVILIGSEFLQSDNSPQMFEMVGKLAKNIGAGIIPLPAQNNLFGSILMGSYPELIPGGFSSRNKEKMSELKEKWGTEFPYFSFGWDKEKFSSDKKKVIYLIGEAPVSFNPSPDFLIFQNIYPPDPSFKADLVLPATAFTEMEGTFIDGEGRIQWVRKGVDPPGEALPDWEILCRLAQKMGNSGFDFSKVKEIQEEISSWIKGFRDFERSNRQAVPLTCEGELTLSKYTSKEKKKKDQRFPFLLSISLVEHTYRGFSLTTRVEGFRKLLGEETLYLNPEDAKQAGISEGDEVLVTSANFEAVWPVRISNQQPPGTMHITLHQIESIGPNPHPVRIRKKNV
jgi:formate dehydrogenase alpha subunit